jgi:membrane-bound ClpP family serine protease
MTEFYPMGDWMSILLLVLIGLILIYLELVFVPGTTVLGVIGLVLTGIGVAITFENYGTQAGALVLVGSLVTSIVALVWSFRKNSWNKFSLKTTNKAKVNPNYTDGLQIEMRGEATSDLKPIGKAEFNNKVYEVTSHGHLIESGEQVKIIKLTGNKIIVESINN